MRSIGDILGSPFKPLLICLVVLAVLGLLASNPTSATTSTSGISCPALTNNAEFNRVLCQLNPARLLDLPVSALLPGFMKG